MLRSAPDRPRFAPKLFGSHGQRPWEASDRVQDKRTAPLRVRRPPTWCSGMNRVAQRFPSDTITPDALRRALGEALRQTPIDQSGRRVRSYGQYPSRRRARAVVAGAGRHRSAGAATASQARIDAITTQTPHGAAFHRVAPFLLEVARRPRTCLPRNASGARTALG